MSNDNQKMEHGGARGEREAIKVKHSLVVLQRVGAHRSGGQLQKVSHPQSMPAR